MRSFSLVCHDSASFIRSFCFQECCCPNAELKAIGNLLALKSLVVFVCLIWNLAVSFVRWNCLIGLLKSLVARPNCLSFIKGFTIPKLLLSKASICRGRGDIFFVRVHELVAGLSRLDSKSSSVSCLCSFRYYSLSRYLEVWSGPECSSIGQRECWQLLLGLCSCPHSSG
jgi:hypothetical protein